MDVMGFVEVIKRYPFFKRIFNDVVCEAERRKPDAVLLVDYPGFNLRMAKQLKKRGIKVFYYVCPQVWAWNRGRIPKMAKMIDRLMVIFPFEVDVFKDVDLQVDFVGHPMVDELRAFRYADSKLLPWVYDCSAEMSHECTNPVGKRPGGPFCEEAMAVERSSGPFAENLPKGCDVKKIALLPGSRRQEIRYILEPLLETAQLLEQSRPDLSFMIPVPERRLGMVEEMLQKAKKVPRNVSVVSGQAREVLKQADAAFVTSGTATLEAALIGCPTVLVYRTSLANYLLARALIRVPWVGIANIISNREIMPERLQNDMTPLKLAATIDPLINDTPARQAMLDHFQALEKRLGPSAGSGQATGAPASRIARIITKSI
jgi:lipid-A-disaccharide synthase